VTIPRRLLLLLLWLLALALPAPSRASLPHTDGIHPPLLSLLRTELAQDDDGGPLTLHLDGLHDRAGPRYGFLVRQNPWSMFDPEGLDAATAGAVWRAGMSALGVEEGAGWLVGGNFDPIVDGVLAATFLGTAAKAGWELGKPAPYSPSSPSNFTATPPDKNAGALINTPAPPMDTSLPGFGMQTPLPGLVLPASGFTPIPPLTLTGTPAQIRLPNVLINVPEQTAGITVLQSSISSEALLEKAQAARDELSAKLRAEAKNIWDCPPCVSAGYNTRTGQVVAKATNDDGSCAENNVAATLGNNLDEIRFTKSWRPWSNQELPICPKCEARFGRDVFPEGTKFKSDD